MRFVTNVMALPLNIGASSEQPATQGRLQVRSQSSLRHLQVAMATADNLDNATWASGTSGQATRRLLQVRLHSMQLP